MHIPIWVGTICRLGLKVIRRCMWLEKLFPNLKVFSEIVVIWRRVEKLLLVSQIMPRSSLRSNRLLSGWGLRRRIYFVTEWRHADGCFRAHGSDELSFAPLAFFMSVSKTFYSYLTDFSGSMIDLNMQCPSVVYVDRKNTWVDSEDVAFPSNTIAIYCTRPQCFLFVKLGCGHISLWLRILMSP